MCLFVELYVVKIIIYTYKEINSMVCLYLPDLNYMTIDYILMYIVKIINYT